MLWGMDMSDTREKAISIHRGGEFTQVNVAIGHGSADGEK